MIVLTDVSSLAAGEAEPDDGQSLVRLMLYANDLDIEGLVASSNLGHGQRVRPDLIRRVVDAYEKARPNLLLHDDPDVVNTHLDRLRAVTADDVTTVTAVVVVHGSPEPTVRASVQSLLESDGVDVHVVLVDNASPDGGVACDGWRGHPRVTVVRSERNGGFAAGVNQGLRRRRHGDMIWLLNDDATVAPDCIARCAATLSEHPEAVVVAAAAGGEQEGGQAEGEAEGEGGAAHRPSLARLAPRPVEARAVRDRRAAPRPRPDRRGPVPPKWRRAR